MEDSHVDINLSGTGFDLNWRSRRVRVVVSGRGRRHDKECHLQNHCVRSVQVFGPVVLTEEGMCE